MNKKYVYIYEICMTDNNMPLVDLSGEAIQFNGKIEAELYAIKEGLKESEYIITWCKW